METVVVLMSVFNGAEYLQEQLDSILGQNDIAVHIIVRDDGSNDRTAEIIASYVERGEPLTYIKGGNIGAANSFMKLVNGCDMESPYYAFSDHDDVWEADKLSTAAHALDMEDSADTPLMYCSRLAIVDENLNHLGFTRIPKKPLSFSNALIETVTAGGTILLNREAFDLLRESPMSTSPMSNIVMHDSWAYLLISAFGRIYYDISPKILYRQHQLNVFGGRHDFAKRWKLRVDRLVNRRNLFRKQAIHFLNNYKDRLNPSKKQILLGYINYRESLLRRILFAFSPTVYTQGGLSNLYMRLLILLGKL